MHTDSPRARWTGLLLAMALLSAGCVPLTPPPGQGLGISEAPACVAGDSRQDPLAAHLVLLRAVHDVSVSTRHVSSTLSRLKDSKSGIASRNSGIFARYIDQGARQLRWIEAELDSTTRLANAASAVEDPDMRLALLHLAGPRLEAAMMGSILLSIWADFLNLADATLAQHLYSAEQLFMDLDRIQKMIEPTMTALSSLEPGQVEAAAQDMPSLVGHLTREFSATREAVRVGAENLEKMLVLKEAVEALTLLSAMKFSLPAAPPAVPATLGLALVVGGDGVMMGTRLVVSAEWVEMMRRLVQAGVLSLPAVSAAVRIQAGQVLLAQAHDELPPGVREALGEGPEVRGMRVTDRAGAGMARPPPSPRAARGVPRVVRETRLQRRAQHRPVLRQTGAGTPPGHSRRRELEAGAHMAWRMESVDHEGAARRRG